MGVPAPNSIQPVVSTRPHSSRGLKKAFEDRAKKDMKADISFTKEIGFFKL